MTAVVCMVLIDVQQINGENYTLSLLYPVTDVIELSFFHYIGAFGMAVDAVNEDSRVNNNNITMLYTIEDTNANSPTQLSFIEKQEQSMRTIMQRSEKGTDAFIGPGLESCTHEARVAAAFDKPLIGYVSK